MKRIATVLSAVVLATIAGCGPTSEPTPIQEDTYGWNCWTDGNKECGDALTETSPGCLTDTRDGYTMCQSGEVYTASRFRDVDGHTGCWIKYGDTSYVGCEDGFRTES